MRFDDVWRLGWAFGPSVASVGGAAASSRAFGTQTYAIQLSFPGSVSSTGSCRIAIVGPNDNAVSSTQGTYCRRAGSRFFAAHPGSVSLRSPLMRGRSLSIIELKD